MMHVAPSLGSWEDTSVSTSSQSLYFTQKETGAREKEVMSLDHTAHDRLLGLSMQLDRPSSVILLEIHGKSES